MLIGNLGADPEKRQTQKGTCVVLRLATTEVWRDKLDENKRQERTEWHKVVIFIEKLIEVASTYLKKGSKVFIEGQLRTSEWEDANKQKRYTTEVILQGFNARLVMLDRAPSSPSNSPYEDTASSLKNRVGSYETEDYGRFSEITDDEIPF